jgi:hypothetical protein
MYSTCLFCNKNLGRNGALEHFQIGRRLAYDELKGRLWVVCSRCERWNLSPLETRWEAIEEAERAFRATRMRVSTDNIGLAQLSEGLQLVRVGKPPQLELAGWRYGDQFGRRRRKHLAVGIGGAALLAGSVVAGVGIGGAASLATIGGLEAVIFWKHLRDAFRIRTVVRDGDGEPLALKHNGVAGSALVANRGKRTWHLKVSHGGPNTWKELRATNRMKEGCIPFSVSELTGDAALRALSAVIPFVNKAGGAAGKVRDAVNEIGAAKNLDALLYAAATHRQYTNNIPGENLVAGLQSRTRLALEMILHENEERRALEGEMQALELRWREAEEIASIADSLLLPADLEERLAALRTKVAE